MTEVSRFFSYYQEFTVLIVFMVLQTFCRFYSLTTLLTTFIFLSPYWTHTYITVFLTCPTNIVEIEDILESILKKKDHIFKEIYSNHVEDSVV